MRVFNNVFNTMTLLQIVVVLGGLVIMKALAAKKKFRLGPYELAVEPWRV